MDLTNHQMWVNSDSKQSHYDGKANPYPDLNTFRKTYAGMTHEQFSLGLARIFNKMRDKHTAFYKAGPYGCFSVSTGLHFQFVDDSLGSSEPPKVRVIMITDNPGILGLIGNVLSTVAIGDELLTVNGLSFKELRRLRGNQELYTVKVPYVALSNDECWSLSSSLYEELNSIPPHEIPAPTSFKQKRSVSGNDTSLLGDSTSQRVDADIHKRSYWESVQFKNTKIDDLAWTIWENGGRNMAQEYRRDFVDIRGNSGGLVHAADGIIQLFKSDATASTFRYLKNDATKSLFYKGLSSNNPWSKAWDATSDTSRYSGFGSMEDSSILNTFGQVYFNPVGVYTNGACYSACETFAAQIQDHGIGTIFGEDEATGGGGASVLSSDDSYFTNRPLGYSVDPFKEKLTGENSGQTFYTKITVGVRQLVRSGKYAGQLIEDNGVKSDVIVRPTIDDILLGDRGVSVYDRIVNYLGDVAKRKVDSKVYFISEPYNRVTFEDSIGIPFVASGVDEIIVVHQGKKFGKWKRESPALSQTDVITVKTPKGLQDHLITFIGTKRGKQVFKTHRQITRMPTSNDRVSMMTANSYTVLGPSSGVGVYNFGSMSEQEGWNFNDGKWIIGDGVSDYSGYMSSTIRVWLTAPVGSTITISLDGIVDTHDDVWSLSLNMMDNSGKMVPVLPSTSDDGSTQSKSATERKRVIDETHSFTVTTERFSLNMNFVSYNIESTLSVKLNSIVITKD
ncbi:hypothetical protein BASA50_000088 [Batrachochytrium salamandrivorans]|uniref:Tail specific protease domain-containing protein n=1 Tax=Batrachochytrium salamandrivorans TaxID=1357716 RepID=A0ABQ8EUZ7_9FUNG|nr:hypothetical protein BASA50_000088 [Batrachochytrium salamandrivorans]